MNISLGLEDASYKYVHGAVNNFKLPFDENKETSLVCGKNDRAAVQLLVYSEQEMLISVNEDACFYERRPIDIVRVHVEVPGLKEGSIKANLIGLVEDDDRQLKSDIILQQPFIHVDGRRVQPIWIEVEIDKDVEPGTYNPQISVFGHRLFEDEVIIRQLSFDIQVVNTTLTDASDYSFNLNLWQHNSNIARKYDLALWSDEHFSIMENYISSLADLGQKALSVIVSEIPWSGQSSSYDRIDPANMFEYNIVNVSLLRNGKWSFDFNALNRYVELGMKHGITQEIEVFGLLNIWVLEDAGLGSVIEDYNDAIRIRYWDESTNTYKFVKYKKDLEKYVQALEQNFIDKGWIDIVRVIADEPSDTEIFTHRLNELKQMAPSFKYKAAINHASFIEQDIEGIMDYIPVLDCIANEFERIQELKNQIKGKMSYYVCCVPEIPNTFIRSHLLESRLIPWLAFHMNIDGFLRWNYTVWPNDPLNKISYHYPFFPAGDTNFVYPGRNGHPLLSLRYKLLQKGIRDYEIFNSYINQGGDREKIQQKMKNVFLWTTLNELHPSARKTKEELFSLQNKDYEDIISEILTEIVKGEAI
ncbi:DUF4091 domain-containing protein [Paenibacillus antarcticus]|uniref:Glycoside hydrolase 123 catalytic domain-containing protein n=1 Tax=Paenibacillus antarcticus TaxID=253703 RepID=A0A168NFM2_9BACL|nr:DUF4091 domain-containing protein [Paenibacillus antarcticus]OAB45747.1 hypothetical protein PBAT_12635 [Paenibacillus antarcticus]